MGAAPFIIPLLLAQGLSDLALEVLEQSLHQVVSFLQKNSSRNLTGSLEKLDEAQEMIHRLIRRIQDSPASEEEAVQALLQDLEGQVTQALSKEEWYNKWGRHYLPPWPGRIGCSSATTLRTRGCRGTEGRSSTTS